MSGRRMLKALAEGETDPAALEERELIEERTGHLDREICGLLYQHQGAVRRLAEVPGLGVDSARQIVAEVGPTAAVFASGKNLSSWVGVCPGEPKSRGASSRWRFAA